ncbi:hypothetical protein BOX15_Mlig023746g1 [Macrostomum lignano]|uniref:Cyclin-like domain-containing protein n=1 Tax=Macrostomum lignano TaxID=282301 RepID=A0A267GJK3_9PLAT|nr:hypothetical protein BOX15_Mlig023746g1 [Macrostomum lignano]
MSARSGITASNVVMNNSSGSTGGRCERRSRRKRMKKRSTPEIAADWSKGNKEARRSESQMFCHLAESPASSEDNSEIEIPHSTNVGVSPSLPKDFEENLEKLLDSELLYHPKADPLFRINAACEDKVDAILRNEAIFNLRFLHKFYNLAPECFAHAVNISDRFIMKIKVKPKYMACVATAAYLIACKMIEDPEDWPSPEKLVSVARCGGSPSDLERMEGIIRTKLATPSCLQWSWPSLRCTFCSCCSRFSPAPRATSELLATWRFACAQWPSTVSGPPCWPCASLAATWTTATPPRSPS